MIIVTDITILFSDLASLIVSLQTWNVKYYKYAIIKNGLKSLIIGWSLGLRLMCSKFNLLFFPALPKKNYPLFLFYAFIITYYFHKILFGYIACR